MTRDLALAAYMHAHGVHVRAAQGWRFPTGVWEYRFEFDDSAKRWTELLVAFTNSPEARFNAAQRDLKRLAKAHQSENV